MTHRLSCMLLTATLFSGPLTTKAQTIATFDDLSLPKAGTSYLQSLPRVDGVYPFQSGNASFYGALQYGGTYETQFNYANIKDTVDPTYANAWAAITGGGVDSSDNYGVAYAEAVGPDYLKSSENGPKLIGDAAGHAVAGLYITNTTLAYHWIKSANNDQSEDYTYQLTIRGYLQKERTKDSVVVVLSKGKNPINTWQWVNLLPLGNVDSLTFQAASTHGMTPFYFAFDNLVTLDGHCPAATGIIAVSLNENSANLQWNNTLKDIVTDYEIAIDQSATKEPASNTPIQVSSTKSYEAKDLLPNTTYYAHVRTKCSTDEFATWDTTSFTTLASTGILAHNANQWTVLISPNPATDHLTMHNKEAAQAVVYNIQGQVMLRATNTRILNIAALPAGLYLLQINDAKGNISGTIRFTKKD